MLRDGEEVWNVLVKELGYMGLVEDLYVYGLVLCELKGWLMDSASGSVVDIGEEVICC